MTPEYVKKLERKVRTLQKKLCCSVCNCSLADRTYTSTDPIDPNQDVHLTVTLNGFTIATGTGPVSTAVSDINAIVEGLGTVSLITDDYMQFVANACLDLGFLATND